MILRVTWDGPAPEPGEWLGSRRGDRVYRIVSVNRLGPRSGGDARYDLVLVRHAPGDRPAGSVLHPWSRAQVSEINAPHPVRLARALSAEGREDDTAPGGPTAVMALRWTDPDDTRPNASARPRQVTGWRAYCPLRRMASMAGSQITDLHIHAADRLRAQYDAGSIGLSAPQDGEARGVGYGPVSGPSAAAVAQAQASEAVRAALAPFTRGQVLMIRFIVLQNMSLQSWCSDRAERTGLNVSSTLEMGRLLSVLDLLVKHYGLSSSLDD